jgi:hypothetical protein
LTSQREYNESASILEAKVGEICDLIPAFEKEIIWDVRGTRAKTKQSKDTVVYTFRNGSTGSFFSNCWNIFKVKTISS